MNADGFKFVDGSGVSITGYEGSATDVIVPATINGHKVTRIEAEAFKDNTTMKSVKLPDTLTNIERQAFWGCTGLTAIELPASLKKIGTRAFADTKITSIYIPSSVTTSNLSLAGANSLDSVEFAPGTKTIPEGACQEVTATRVTIPATVKSVGDYAFQGAQYLTDVYFNGTKTQREAITFETGNSPLLKAEWHYAAAPAADITIYRLYNRHTGEHFYTTSKEEAATDVKFGWTDETAGAQASGGVWKAATYENGIPVYRLYNAGVGVHHYTTSVTERDTLVGRGWKYEDVAFYGDKAQGVPVYRQYNPNNKQHNYTPSTTERDYLVKIGWKDEGICWYGVK